MTRTELVNTLRQGNRITPRLVRRIESELALCDELERGALRDREALARLAEVAAFFAEVSDMADYVCETWAGSEELAEIRECVREVLEGLVNV